MLHEFERVALQKLALQKLNSSDLGVTTRIPKGNITCYENNASVMTIHVQKSQHFSWWGGVGGCRI
jgi:hypothetical protein